MDFNRIQLKKEIRRLPSKRSSLYNDKRLAETVHYWDGLASHQKDKPTLHNVNDRHEFYSDDRTEKSSGSEIIQCARRDRKKEKWKQSRGRLNWKHGRKKRFDMKHPVFDEVLSPIVSDIMRSSNFDETHYLAPEGILLSLFDDTNVVISSRLEEYIRNFYLKSPKDVMSNFEEFYKFIMEEGEKILETDSEIRKYVTKTGNCGEIANFLYEGSESPRKVDLGDFNEFIQELHEEIFEDKVKLIRAISNIGHTFTLICYKQGGKTVIELIQAWQGEYSVTKSLNSANLYINHDLANKFNAMHSDLTRQKGREYYREVFLNAPLKEGINNLEITHLNVRLLDERPEQYARRIASKKLKRD